jgi:hypothetical protein
MDFKGLPVIGYSDKVVYSNVCHAVIDKAKLVLDGGTLYLMRRVAQADILDIYFGAPEREPMLIASIESPATGAVTLDLTRGDIHLSKAQWTKDSFGLVFDEATRSSLARNWGYSKAGENHTEELRKATEAALAEMKVAQRREELASIFEKLVRA